MDTEAEKAHFVTKLESHHLLVLSPVPQLQRNLHEEDAPLIKIHLGKWLHTRIPFQRRDLKALHYLRDWTQLKNEIVEVERALQAPTFLVSQLKSRHKTKKTNHLQKHLNICDGSKFFRDEDNTLKKKQIPKAERHASS